MVQQLFEVFFVITLVALAAAPVIGVLLLALPRKKLDRAVTASHVHAHV
jgi:hypothetical protein